MKFFQYVLWLLVALVAGAMAMKLYLRMTSPPVVVDPVDGRYFEEISWNWLPGVADFELTDQNGIPVRSDQLVGRPLVVNTFFASCPDICRRFNGRIKQLCERFGDRSDVVFLSVTCDPANDTTEVLSKYAATFDADVDKWKFLTGPQSEIDRFAGQSLGAVIYPPQSHTEDIMLIDRWGRYRDRFDWDDAKDLKRFGEVLAEVAAEKKPPIGQTIRTRNVLAAGRNFQPDRLVWLYDFQLHDANGKVFRSRGLTGRVWVGCFFDHDFEPKPSINSRLAAIQSKLKEQNIDAVSIAAAPHENPVSELRKTMTLLNADPKHWHFVQGQLPLVERIANEFFGESLDTAIAKKHWFLVDRWGIVRERFDSQDPESIDSMFELAKRLNAESAPPTFDSRRHR